eukprot:347524-Pelagomonas_calceolata.AAC.2
METQPIDEPVSKGIRSNYKQSITSTQIIHTFTNSFAANLDAMTPAVHDSSTEGPPSKQNSEKYPIINAPI